MATKSKEMLLLHCKNCQKILKIYTFKPKYDSLGRNHITWKNIENAFYLCNKNNTINSSFKNCLKGQQNRRPKTVLRNVYIFFYQHLVSLNLLNFLFTLNVKHGSGRLIYVAMQFYLSNLWFPKIRNIVCGFKHLSLSCVS